MNTNLKWSRGNSKLKKLRTVAFDIPAFKSADGFITCPGAAACAAVCYARQRTFTWPAKKNAMEFNLKFARQDNFAELAIADLTRIKAKLVRIHASGDFYSQAYLNAWIQIASAFPDKLFYAYSKNLKLDFSRLPINFRLTQSVGGKWDAQIDTSKSHARIFSDHKARRRVGYVDGNIHDGPAVNGAIKIGLVYHGLRNLTVAQERYFA